MASIIWSDSIARVVETKFFRPLKLVRLSLLAHADRIGIRDELPVVEPENVLTVSNGSGRSSAVDCGVRDVLAADPVEPVEPRRDDLERLRILESDRRARRGRARSTCWCTDWVHTSADNYGRCRHVNRKCRSGMLSPIGPLLRVGHVRRN